MRVLVPRIAGGAIESYAAWGIMPLWMRVQRTALLRPLYTIDQLNHYPLGIAGVAILALIVSVRFVARIIALSARHDALTATFGPRSLSGPTSARRIVTR